MKEHRKEWPQSGRYPRRGVRYGLDGRGRPFVVSGDEKPQNVDELPGAWRVGRAEFGPVMVSCVFLGTDVNPFTSRPNMYELMMTRGGQTYVWRYGSRRVALTEYRDLVRRARRVWEGPEPLGVRYGKRGRRR